MKSCNIYALKAYAEVSDCLTSGMYEADTLRVGVQGRGGLHMLAAEVSVQQPRLSSNSLS